jgi:hypothetical protein
MVRTEALQRVRIVEDHGPHEGSIVMNDAGVTSDPDTLFPLQAALGYDIAQNLFIGNRNIGSSGFSVGRPQPNRGSRSSPPQWKRMAVLNASGFR